MPREQIFVKRLDEHATLPTKAHAEDAGWDLYASEEVTIPPGGYAQVPVGIAIELPVAHFGRITGRSSTWRNLRCLTIEGIIDEGFRGELFAGLWNTDGTATVQIRQGERVAQLLVHFVEPTTMEWADVLSTSARGENGFGSSGR